MLDEKQKLTQIIDLGHELARVRDVDLLLERILTLARFFVNADAGSIYIKEKDRLKFQHTQNDTMQSQLAPGKKIIYSTFTVPIDSKTLSGHVASTGRMLNIPDVGELPPGVPFSFGKQYDEISNYRTQSVITLPLKTHLGDAIGVLQLIDAKNEKQEISPFSREDEPLIKHFANNAAMAIERAQMTRGIILRMIKMAEMRDPKETGAHANRVASYSVEIYEAWARQQGLPEAKTENDKDILRMAAMLHDVGKVAIPDTILKKPGRLNAEEFETIKTHSHMGARMFSDPYSDLDQAAFIVSLDHHEKWNGFGYPGFIDPLSGEYAEGQAPGAREVPGKKGVEAHPFGRAVAVADVFDALSSKRSYKDAWDEDRVLETLESDSGKHFDPDMIQAFFSCLEVIRMIAKRYPDEA